MAGFRGLIALGATAAALLAAPALAHAEVLFDQTDNAAPPNADDLAPNFAPSNDFGPGNEDRTADDFVVPAGERWAIDGVEVTGAYESGPSPVSDVNVYIYPEANGEPAPALFSQLSTSTTGGPNYVVPLTGVPELEPGTYWLTVQQDQANMGYWSWGTRTVQTGSAALWLSAGGPPGCESPGWNERAICWPSDNPDQTFQLTGTSTLTDTDPPETTITKAPKDKSSKNKAKYKFSSDEAGSTFECKIDKKPYKACTSPKKFKAKDGKHKFKVIATDPAGNADPTAAKDKFKVTD